MRALNTKMAALIDPTLSVPHIAPDPQFSLLHSGWSPVRAAGVDEAGRGPLAGPVIAAAVVLDLSRPIDGLRDSKKLTLPRREALAAEIREHSAAFCVARAEVAEIDELNILRASLLAMERAVSGLGQVPEVVYVDGNMLPSVACPAVALVKGDDRLASISAASILAKVARDQEMCRWADTYPAYGFEKHKGYGTRDHLAALAEHGPCALHRHSFAPVAKAAHETAPQVAAL